MPSGTWAELVVMNDPGSLRAVAEAANRFAFDLYSRLAQDRKYDGRNIFFSPFSVVSALAILYEGARGKTAGEIRSVLRLAANDTLRREGFSGLNVTLTGGGSGFVVCTVNALWAEQSFPFIGEYVSMAERFYGARATGLDFRNRPEDSRRMINTRIGEWTKGRIRELIPPGTIRPEARLVITSAIRFQGDWEMRFDPADTANADFRISPGRSVTVPMMQRTGEGAEYMYSENCDWQMLSMPYTHITGKGISMIVLLPRAGSPVTAGDALNAGTLSALQQSAESCRVDVFIPKFAIGTRCSLPVTLSAMGMPAAFTGEADFSGMDGTKNLYVSDMIHQASIGVHEQGTEAAAATAAGPVCYASENPEIPAVFRADHPFLFLVLDNGTGAILFMGRVVCPAAEKGVAG